MSFSLSVGEFPLPRFSLPSSLKVRPCIKEMGEICQGLSNTSEGREAAKETDFCCSFLLGNQTRERYRENLGEERKGKREGVRRLRRATVERKKNKVWSAVAAPEASARL